MSGNFSCVKCEKTFKDNSSLFAFDDTLNMGTCSSCFKPILPRQEERIRKYGSPEKIAEMEMKLEVQNKKYKQSTNHVETIEVSTKKFNQPKKKSFNRRPDVVTYEACAAIFWYHYQQIVYRETEKRIGPNDLDGNMKEVIKNFIKYLIGYKNELFPLKKSVYLWGSYGVGKSTILLAGLELMDHIAQTTKWNDRNYKLVSLSKMFFTARNNSDLTGYDKISKGHYALDEMKAKQFDLKYYGSNVEIMPTLFEMRHDEWKYKGTRTIICSNISPKILREELIKDEILMSRIMQEYTIVKLDGENKRPLPIKEEHK